MADKLMEIERNDWQKLKNLYSPDGSKSYFAYTTIDNYIRWLERDPNLKHVKFYCLNGDFSDGTFVMIDWNFGYADTFDVSNGNLSKLLDLIDYTKVYTFMALRPEVRPVVVDSMRKLNVEMLREDEFLLYRLKKEKTLEFDVQPPNGVTLRPITDPHDIEKANPMYIFRDHLSLGYFRRWAKYNVNFGAFADGVLAVWVFRYESGLVGALQSDEKYIHRGYGSLVTKSISKSIAEMRQDAFACVYETNRTSKRFFEKLGYEPTGKMYRILTKHMPAPWEE